MEGARSDIGPARVSGAAWILTGVFLAALAARLVYLRQLHTSGLWDFLRLDPLYYHDWARRIADGDLVGSGTFEMTPLYAYVLGGVFKLLGPSLLWPRILQAALGAATCALVAFLATRISGRAAGLVGGLTMAFYGPAIFHDTQIMKTVLTVFLSTATAALLYLSRGSRLRLLAAGGACLGLTALAQENINVTLPFLLAWIAWRSPRGRRLAAGAILLTAFAVVVAPATIRNYRVSGELVLITSGGGEVLYTGTWEGASGKYAPPLFVRPNPFYEHEDFRQEAARRLGRPVSRRESDAYWWKESFRLIRDDPARYAWLLWDKLATYFNSYERPDNYSYYNFALFVPMLALPLPHFGWVAPFGLLGLALPIRRRTDLFPVYAVMGAYILSALLFFTQSRYRMPMVPLLVVFGAHAAVRVAGHIRRLEWRPLGAGLAALGLLALFVNRDPGNEAPFVAQNEAIVGEMMLVAGRPVEAGERFQRALDSFRRLPAPDAGHQRRVIAECHYGLARALDESGRGSSDAVIGHLEEAAGSNDPETRLDSLTWLARLRSDRGDDVGAARALAGAVEASPRDPELRLEAAEALHKAGDLDGSLSMVQSVIDGFPDLDSSTRASAYYGRALLHRSRGETQATLDDLAECLRLNPDHPRAAWIRDQLRRR